MHRLTITLSVAVLAGLALWTVVHGWSASSVAGSRRDESADKAKLTLPDPMLLPGKVVKQPTNLPAVKGVSFAGLDAYPCTSGSTSAEPLGVWVACRMLGRGCMWPERTWGDQRLKPAREKADLTKPFHEIYDPRFYLHIQHGGTHGAYVALINGEVDLIFECRKPSTDEENLLEQKKIELEIHPIALDAFVFLRHRDNPVKELKLSQIQEIYTFDENYKSGKLPANAMVQPQKGKIANWKDVGGPNAEIHAYIRNRNSGSQEMMMDLVMKDRKIISGRGMTGFTMAGPYNHLHNDKQGIGYTFFYYEHYMSPPPRDTRGDISQSARAKQQGKQEEKDGPLVEMFAIDGVIPTRETIADGSYPLVTEVYVVTRKGMKDDHPAAKLRDWLLTAEGQKVIGETGYVPLPSKASEHR